MLIVNEITQENLNKYIEYLEPDKAENIGRSIFRAIALSDTTDDALKAALMWELKNTGSGQEITAEFLEFYAEDEEAAQEIILAYEKEARKDNVVNTIVELPADWDDIRVAALKKSGFELQEQQGREVTLCVGGLMNVPAASKRIATPNIVSIGSLSLQQFRKGIMNCMFSKTAGYMDDLSDLPIDWFETNLSCCILTDGIVRGFLLIHKTISAKLEVKFMLGFGQVSSQDIFKMIQFAIYKALESYPSETEVVIKFCDEETGNLIEKLFLKKADNKIIEGKRKEQSGGRI